MMTLLDRFKDYIDHNAMATHADKILLTVSGGVDSMVMLDLFVAAGYSVGVAHCNFQLRGDESDEDELLVAQRAQALGVELFNRRFDTALEVERSGDSMEMVARRQRYEWFEELCVEHGYNIIAVAHHIDDSVETFFINLFRGTGLKGLTGITAHRGKIIRPMMFAQRKDILEWASHHKVPYREDSSNRSTKYLRNKIRLGLIPRVKEINPKFSPIMRQNIERLINAQRFINASIEKIASEVMSSNEGIYTLDVERIDEALPRDFVIYELLNSSFGFKGDVVDSLIASSKAESSGRRFYSKEYVAYTNRGEILITRIAEDDPCEVVVEPHMLRNYCGNSVLFYERLDVGLLDSFSTPTKVALLDADKLSYPLTIRRWREGDQFTPFGMSGRKKVSDFLIDEKVSQPEKERQFVLVSATGEIAWLIGRRISERFKLDGESENILRITKEIL
ncbi:MAG: tRNA lysidine(34) synthetase TilS [Rikenellaceae bacterium]